MTNLIFATNNHNKVKEIQHAIGSAIKVISLKEAGIDIDIPEPFNSLEENAQEKTRTIFELKGENCFGEDTGLEVEALGGEPGVKSARYAGESRSSEDNISKLLTLMAGIPNRRARFKTVICLIWNRTYFTFEGICEGVIQHEKRGDGGFGYDPVFVPDGSSKTFAEMGLEEKNRYSHRKKAAEKLILFLQNQS
jgi:XTP/dITP diphosphohydrolase